MKLNKIIKEEKEGTKVIDASKMLSNENKFNIIESFLKEHNNKFMSNGNSFRVKVENRNALGNVVEMLKENKATYNIKRIQDENYRYAISVFGKEPLKEGNVTLREQVSDEAYEIAETIFDSLQGDGKREITYDEFNEQLTLAIRKLYGIDNVWGVVDNKGKFEINGKSFDIDELETDIRGILKYNGWSTIFEGDNEGGLSLGEGFNNLKKGKGTPGILYKVFKKYYNDLLDLNTRMASYINDDKEFVLDDQDYLALGALIDAFDGDPFDDVDLDESKSGPKKGCAHNPKEKKHFEGEIKEQELKESENPGARVTTLDDGEKIIKERGHVSLSKKGDRYIVRYAPGYYVRDIKAKSDDEAIKQFLGESHLKESISDDEIIDVLGVNKDEKNPYWRNREELIKQYRELKDKFPQGEIYLKGDEPYWEDDGKKIGSSKYLVSVQMREHTKEEDQEKEHIAEELKLLVDINDYRPWGGAISLWDEIVDNNKVDTLEFMLEDIYPDGITMTQLNDILWFEQDWVRQQLGLESFPSDEEE